MEFLTSAFFSMTTSREIIELITLPLIIAPLATKLFCTSASLPYKAGAVL